MVGLGPPLAAARVVAWAEAIWLKGIIRAALATARAGMMRRSLACCAARAIFTVVSFSGECRACVRSHGEALTGKFPCFDCAAGNWQRVSATSLHFCQRRS